MSWIAVAAIGYGGYQMLKDDKSAMGSSPGIDTKEITDPLKQNVATPLSKFLSEKVGQGVDPYPGQIAAGIPGEAKNRFNEFLSLDSEEFFKENVADPTINQFKRDLMPLIDEGYAGSLRGSGRFRAGEDAAIRLSENLATQRAALSMALPKEQFGMAMQFQQAEQQKLSMEFKEWIRQQPEYNPILDKAINYLNEQTSTGTDVLAGMNPGQAGWLPQLLGSGIQAVGSIGGGAMAGLAACLPVGTKIDLEVGTLPVQDVKLGDKVVGGTVIATSKHLRKDGHKFSKHKTSTGTVVCTMGHPINSAIINVQEVDIEADDYTYDILTDSGMYFIGGVSMGSTISKEGV